MGQKVNPIGLRLGIVRTWDSNWYADKDFATLLHADMAIRKFLHKKLLPAGIAKIVIERPARKCRVNIHAARPGVIIGKKGENVDKLRQEISRLTKADEIQINIIEVRKPEIDAALVAESIAQQMERRVSYRRASKRAMQTALRLGALGIRVNCSGRLGGAEIARMEWYREGRVPLHTLRADIDYGFNEAMTTYGKIGVKVWIYKGDVLSYDPKGAVGRPRTEKVVNN